MRLSQETEAAGIRTGTLAAFGVIDSKAWGPAEACPIDFPYIESLRGILADASWRFVHASQWSTFSHITNGEIRAAAFSVKHRLRSISFFNCRHVIISDSMASILCLTKGRTSAPSMLRSTRLIAGLSLATGATVRWRWIPSELNPADAASRGGWHWFGRGDWTDLAGKLGSIADVAPKEAVGDRRNHDDWKATADRMISSRTSAKTMLSLVVTVRRKG